MMARAKRIYRLIIKDNKLFSCFSLRCFPKGNGKHVLRVSNKSLGELEKAVETLATACIPTALIFLFSQT